MNCRFAHVARWIVAIAATGAALAASATPITLPLYYVPHNGYAMTGSVTFDDSLLVPDNLVGDAVDTTGLIDVTLTATGPGIPGGSTTFVLADMAAWYFSTDGAGRISDINFFGNPNGVGCFAQGLSTFNTAIVCSQSELVVLRLDLNGASVPVPALAPGAMASLAGLLALAAWVTIRRRRA